MIEIKDCVMAYNDTVALDGISLTIPDGCSYGLLGANAAGKSTLMKILCGIYKQTSGSVKIDGMDVYDNAEMKSKIFFIDDETIQFSSMTLKEMKKYYSAFYPDFSSELFDRLVATVGLPTDRKLHTFSKGMKRQAVMICGVSCRTRYLLIDEAFDGLDQTMRSIIKKILIDAMLDNELTVIFSSHNLGEIDEFCDRAGLLYNGKVVFDRELDDVESDIVKIRAAFDRDITADDLPDIEILHIEKSGSLTEIIAKGGTAKVRTAAEKLSPKFMDDIRLSLKEIFIYEMEGVGYDSSKLDD